ncbi:phage head-tail connector protein [Clostridium botulinum]|uniref:phage head-tail connector protein n=1 Tax=Clostridium botulinum TaxID=1491 RepID=UPI001E3A61FB|nr:phage head-tail connector protein [Clostridium botulinum]MCD3223790.1 hypothetical protein [Clostridium botulinum C/D]MCD3295310.1 hypothetical protein [Clostridium botulinum C/D]
MITLDDIKIRLEMNDSNENDPLILAHMEDVCDFVRDYLRIDPEEELPLGLRGTVIKMVEFSFNDVGIKRRKTKDIDIEYNNNYPKYIYKALNKYKRLKTV